MWIEDKYYKMILERMPIPTVDVIQIFKGKFLFLKRVNSLMKSKWWLPDGRVRKGETLEEAVSREVQEETGLECRSIR